MLRAVCERVFFFLSFRSFVLFLTLFPFWVFVSSHSTSILLCVLIQRDATKMYSRRAAVAAIFYWINKNKPFECEYYTFELIRYGKQKRLCALNTWAFREDVQKNVCYIFFFINLDTNIYAIAMKHLNLFWTFLSFSFRSCTRCLALWLNCRQHEIDFTTTSRENVCAHFSWQMTYLQDTCETCVQREW